MDDNQASFWGVPGGGTGRIPPLVPPDTFGPQRPKEFENAPKYIFDHYLWSPRTPDPHPLFYFFCAPPASCFILRSGTSPLQSQKKAEAWLQFFWKLVDQAPGGRTWKWPTMWRSAPSSVGIGAAVPRPAPRPGVRRIMFYFYIVLFFCAPPASPPQRTFSDQNDFLGVSVLFPGRNKWCFLNTQSFRFASPE